MILFENDITLYLVLFSFIVDIRPSSEYTSDERNKHFSFSKKATLKASILGISWKNQKDWTRYPMILYKRGSIADIF